MIDAVMHLEFTGWMDSAFRAESTMHQNVKDRGEVFVTLLGSQRKDLMGGGEAYSFSPLSMCTPHLLGPGSGQQRTPPGLSSPLQHHPIQNLHNLYVHINTFGMLHACTHC